MSQHQREPAEPDSPVPEADESTQPEADESTQLPSTTRQKKHRPLWIEVPVLLVVAFALTFVIQTFFYKVYYIPSGSMEQTLHGATSGGDRVLVNKLIYDLTDPQPGDVAVFSGPPTWAAEASIPGPDTWYGKFFQSVGSVVGIAPANEKDFVKRVIATAGQTVQCCDEQGRLLVDGKPLDEPYIYQDFPFTAGTLDCSTSPISMRCFGPVTVPAESLWMMGDNRLHSGDSTAGCRGGGSTCQGAIPVENVIGKVNLVVMPIGRWQTVDSYDNQGTGN